LDVGIEALDGPTAPGAATAYDQRLAPARARSSAISVSIMMSDVGVDESLLQEIVRRVLLVARPDRIILFGSAATGKMTKDSDIDLLVLEKEPENRHERSVVILEALNDIEYPFDVIVMRTERFERTKRWIGGIAYPANKYGRVIYEAA
jgi:uncharacterized protein